MCLIYICDVHRIIWDFQIFTGDFRIFTGDFRIFTGDFLPYTPLPSITSVHVVARRRNFGVLGSRVF